MTREGVSLEGRAKDATCSFFLSATGSARRRHCAFALSSSRTRSTRRLSQVALRVCASARGTTSSRTESSSSLRHVSFAQTLIA